MVVAWGCSGKIIGDPLEQAFPNIKHKKVNYSNDASSTCDLWKVLSTNKSKLMCDEVLSNVKKKKKPMQCFYLFVKQSSEFLYVFGGHLRSINNPPSTMYTSTYVFNLWWALSCVLWWLKATCGQHSQNARLDSTRYHLAKTTLS
jgi:hypothetical protein